MQQLFYSDAQASLPLQSHLCTIIVVDDSNMCSLFRHIKASGKLLDKVQNLLKVPFSIEFYASRTINDKSKVNLCLAFCSQKKQLICEESDHVTWSFASSYKFLFSPEGVTVNV